MTMESAMKPPSQTLLSEDGSLTASPPDPSEPAIMQEFHKRLRHSDVDQRSTSEDVDHGTGMSSDSDTGDPNDGHDDGIDDDVADMTMGERVTHQSLGPQNNIRRRHQRGPGMLPIDKHVGQKGRHLSAKAGQRLHGDPPEHIKRRVNKNAPVEERISHRPVVAARDSVQKKSVKPLDPRFLAPNKLDDQHESDLARRRYRFLYDKTMPSEVKELKASLRNATSASEHRQLQIRLSRLQQSLKQHEDRSLELQVEHDWKTSQKTQVEAGKKPYYLKESEKRKRVMEKKFAQLEEAGQLEKYMSKKRKRVASKLHKKLPFRRASK